MENRLRKRAFKFTDAFGQPISCVHRFGAQLVGISLSNQQGIPRIELVNNLKQGAKLILVPEPQNPVDRNAILIYRADDLENDLGYMDSGSANRFCKMIERGAKFDAQVCWINRRRSFLEIHLYLFQMSAPTLKRRPMRQKAPTYTKPSPVRKSFQRTSIKPEDESRAVIPIHRKGPFRRILHLLFG